MTAPPEEAAPCRSRPKRAARNGPEASEEPVGEAPFAPWGVQLAANFSKERALASFTRMSERYAKVIGEVRPMVIGTRLRSRGSAAFYRVRLPASTRAGAEQLCGKIRAAGGDCVVLRS